MPDRINPELQAGQTGGIATGNLGRPNAVSNIGQARARQAQTDSFGPDLLQGILGFAEGITKMAWQDQTEREYERAAKARRSGKAFEELEGNPLLKPFRRGGFQDMDFQMGQAAMQAEALKLSKEMPQMTPEQMQVWMDSKSSDIWTAAGNGLSRQQRSVAMQAQMKLEDSIMSQHTKAHANWIIQDSYNKLSALATSNVLGIQASGGDMESVQNMAATMLRIKEELPWEMSGPVLQHILKTLYEDGYRHQADALFKGGPDGMGVTAGWDLEARYAMEAASRKAQEKEWAEVSTETALTISQIVAGYNAGGRLTPEEVDSLPESVRQVLGNIALGRYMAGKTSGAAANKQAEMAAAYALQSPAELNLRGLQTQQSSNAHYAGVKAITPDQPTMFVATQMVADAAHGFISPDLVKDLGTSLGAMVNSPDGQISKYHQDMVNTFMGLYKTYYSPGTNKLRMGQVDSMLPAELQGLLPQFALDNTGRPSDELIQEWRAAKEHELLQVASNRLAASKNVQGIIEGFTATMQDDASGTMMRYLKDITGLGAKEVEVGSPTWNTYFQEGLLEMQHILNSDPAAAGLYRDMPEVLYGRALQGVKERTITLTADTGFLGRNQNRHIVLPRHNGRVPEMDMLHTDRSGQRIARDPRHIEEALKKQIPTREGFSVVFQYEAAGVFPVYVSDDDSAKAFKGTPIDFEKASRHIDDMMDKQYGTYGDSVLGTDVTMRDTKSGADITIRMDGKNLSGIDTVKVLEWRKALAADESVRQEVYDDITRGKGGEIVRAQKAFGIGHSVPAENIHMSQHLFKDGRISPEAISNTFASDTTQAIRDASRIAERVGIHNEDAVLAIAEMVFQMGVGKAKNFETTFQHIAAGRRYSELEARAKDWPWYQQTPKRVDKFLRAVKPAYRD